MNNIKLSIQLSAVECKTVTCPTVDDLIDTITSQQWCPGVYKERSSISHLGPTESNRRNEFFINAPSIFGIDIDNTYTKNEVPYPVITMEQASKRLLDKGLSYLIAPTKSHQTIKPGHEAAGAVDRFRIILFLSEPVKTLEEYKKVFNYLRRELFPEMDKKCSDPARFYYPSTSVEFGDDEGNLLQVAEILIKEASTIDLIRQQFPAIKAENKPGTKQKIPQNVADVLLYGLGGEGGRNDRLAVLCRYYVGHLKLSEAEILEKVTPLCEAADVDEAEMRRTVRSALNTRVEFTLDVNMNGALFEKLVRSRLIYNVDDTSDIVFVFDETSNKYETFDMSVVAKLFPKDAIPMIRARTTAAKISYEPFNSEVFTLADTSKGETFHKFNVYSHPEWRKAQPQDVQEIPELYKRFFKHLVKEDEASYEYILDWLANALTNRNLTVLCAIASEEGTGKGVFGAIMSHLVGADNFNKVRDEIFKNKFNSGLRNKRIVHVDEIRLRSDEEMNRFKDIINNSIEIERKGKDAESVLNYASFYLSSNNIDAIRPSASDRRFSIIEMSETKLIKVFSKEEINKLTSGYMIGELGWHLLNREIKNDMYMPFKSAQYENIKDASLAPWQEYMLDDFYLDNKGKEVQLKTLQTILKDMFGANYVPGRLKIEKFCKDNPEYLNFRQKKDGSRVIVGVRSRHSSPPEEQEAAPDRTQDVELKINKLKGLASSIKKEAQNDSYS